VDKYQLKQQVNHAAKDLESCSLHEWQTFFMQFAVQAESTQIAGDLQADRRSE